MLTLVASVFGEHRASVTGRASMRYAARAGADYLAYARLDDGSRSSQ